MNNFFRFYGWGMKMKLHMSIYALALVFSKCMAALFMGEKTVEIMTMFEMLVLAMVFAIIEAFLFPEGIIFAKSVLVFRTVVWVAVCNLLFAGGALVFRWFVGVPQWGMWILLFVLEIGLAAMWFGINIVLRVQTAELNRSLKHFQEKH